MTAPDDPVPAGGLQSQVKPTFMVPAVGMSAFGGLLAPTFAPVVALVHALSVGAALYTAHLVDEYVDAHVREEDAPMVAEPTARRAIVATSVACLSLAGVLAATGRVAAASSALLLWVLALLHAPVLDRNVVAVTADYPVGIAVALAGGFLAQRATLDGGVAAIAVVFVVVLSGVKVSIDRLDRAFDRTIAKRTIPVVLGPRRAKRVSAGLFVAGGGVVSIAVALDALPVAALLGLPFLLGGAVAGLGDSADRTVRRQMTLVYPVSVALFVAQCTATGCVVETVGGGLLTG